MKDNIHPPYYDKVQVRCACGTTFTTGSTVKEITVEVCSACHPFYTGKKKLVDVAGRVDRFRQRLKDTEAAKSKRTKHPEPRRRAQEKGKSQDSTVKLR